MPWFSCNWRVFSISKPQDSVLLLKALSCSWICNKICFLEFAKKKKVRCTIRLVRLIKNRQLDLIFYWTTLPNFATDFPYLYVWREEVQRSGTFDKFYKNLFCKMRLLETVVMTDDSYFFRVNEIISRVRTMSYRCNFVLNFGYNIL